MTKIPERIWASKYYWQDWRFSDCTMTKCDETQEYIRKDVSDALIAAALEEAANEVHQECWTDGGAPSDAFIVNAEQATTKLAMDAIKAVTPTDARAALDAMLKAEREKALREAAELPPHTWIAAREEINRLKQMVEIACDVLKEEGFDALRNYDDATCDGMCISDDLKSAFDAHIDTLDALAEKDAKP